MVTSNILVADDDTAIRTLLGQAVSPAGTTGDAATLWRWVELGEGDLIITDVVMPDENAFEILPKRKKARSSDYRHERAEFIHDRDQGV
jgi:two-component system, NtrC family, nitrogen regulation response regulator GlnG